MRLNHSGFEVAALPVGVRGTMTQVGFAQLLAQVRVLLLQFDNPRLQLVDLAHRLFEFTVQVMVLRLQVAHRILEPQLGWLG